MHSHSPRSGLQSQATEPELTYQQAATRLAALPAGQAAATLDLLARLLDLTATQISRRLNGAITPGTISRKQRGTRAVKSSDLWPLAGALGVEVEVLLTRPSGAAAWVAANRAGLLDKEPHVLS